jgi:hypothetical protein
MFNSLRSRADRKGIWGLPSPAMVVAMIALFVGLSGTGYAATRLVSSGATAAKSTRGKTGPRGKTGKAGKTGKTGAVGPAGPRGPEGATGATGPRGLTGTTGPKGPTGSSGVVGEITVVATATVTNGTFGSTVADCPSGYEAIGGGVDLNNVNTMLVTESTPRIGGTRPILLAAGQHGTADAWQGAAVNNGTTPQSMAVTAICAPTS